LPRTVIATAAVMMIPGAGERVDMMRRPAILADAAHVVLTRDARQRPATSSLTKSCWPKSVSRTFPATRSCRPAALPDLFLD
jgi:citronellol/citronellal dehydrogenase